MRLFFAIALDDAARKAIVEARERLALDPSRFRPVREDALHLTLRFLGDVADERLAALAAAGRGVARETSPFPCDVGTIGAFPRGGRATVVWVGLTDRSGTEALARLAARLEGAVRAAGFPADERALTPHVTIARAKVPSRVPIAASSGAPPLARVDVDAMSLVRSHLGAGGSRYEALERFPFLAWGA